MYNHTLCGDTPRSKLSEMASFMSSEQRGVIPAKSEHKRIHRIDKKYLQYSGLEWMYWFAAATGTFTTVYLQQLGMDTDEVGFISALNSAISIISMPIWGMLSDKLRSIKKVFIIAVVISAIIVPLIPLIGGIKLGPIFIFHFIIPISCFFRNPVGSLTDSWVVQASNRQGLNYGGIRLWGSISFAIMAIGLAALLPKIGVQYSFFGYTLACIPLIAVAVSIKDDAQKGRSIPLRELHIGQLLKNSYYICYLIFCIALNMPLNTTGTFMPYLIKEIGADSTLVGLLSGYKAIIEVPMLFLMIRFRKRFRMPAIIVAAGVFHISELLLYSTATSFYHILLVGTLQGLAQGLFIGIGTNYVYMLAPDNLKATAQTFNGAMNSIAGIVGNALGGVLVKMIGVKEFFWIAGLMILGALTFFVLSFPFCKYVLKQPTPLAAKDPREIAASQL